MRSRITPTCRPLTLDSGERHRCSSLSSSYPGPPPTLQQLDGDRGVRTDVAVDTLGGGTRGRVGFACPSTLSGMPSRGFEQLDEIPGGVGHQDLASTRSRGQLTSERHASRPKPGDLGVEICNDQMDSISSGHGGDFRCRTGTGTPRSRQQQPQPALGDVGERPRGITQQCEPEMGCVEVDGRLNVIDNVSDIGEPACFGHNWSSLCNVAARPRARLAHAPATR